ncbi:MAG: phosphatase PAP2 family protein [Anaerolineae bacterium]|jgi:membrane-associated phospholipid phosphatase
MNQFVEDLLGLNGWALELILWVQSWSNSFLDAGFWAITQLGYEPAYLVIVPVVYWCINRSWGARLFLLVILSTWVNEALKNLLRQPRPDPSVVRQLDPSYGYGLPSNHAQTGGVIVWGYLAAKIRRPWFTVLAVIMIFLIGFSRIYLGAHFPMDVVSGWLLGLLVLGLMLTYEDRLIGWFGRLSGAGQAGIVLGLALLILFATPADNLHRYPAATAADLSGLMLGAGFGWLLEQRTVRFRVEGSLGRKVVRYLVGTVVILAVYLAGHLIPDSPSWAVQVGIDALQLAAVALAAVWLGPWVFVRLHLAESDLD